MSHASVSASGASAAVRADPAPQTDRPRGTAALGVVIPHYNDPVRLRTCLDALAPLIAAAVEAVVIDNDSPCDLAATQAAHPWARFVTEPGRVRPPRHREGPSPRLCGGSPGQPSNPHRLGGADAEMAPDHAGRVPPERYRPGRTGEMGSPRPCRGGVRPGPPAEGPGVNETFAPREAGRGGDVAAPAPRPGGLNAAPSGLRPPLSAGPAQR